jgi:hypothetical protein
MLYAVQGSFCAKKRFSVEHRWYWFGAHYVTQYCCCGCALVLLLHGVQFYSRSWPRHDNCIDEAKGSVSSRLNELLLVLYRHVTVVHFVAGGD